VRVAPQGPGPLDRSYLEVFVGASLRGRPTFNSGYSLKEIPWAFHLQVRIFLESDPTAAWGARGGTPLQLSLTGTRALIIFGPSLFV
jgi:hypothetical protein